MTVVLFILLWLAAPFAELAVIVVLAEKNRQQKKKIDELEHTFYYRQAQRQWAPADNGQQPQQMPVYPGYGQRAQAQQRQQTAPVYPGYGQQAQAQQRQQMPVYPGYGQQAQAQQRQQTAPVYPGYEQQAQAQQRQQTAPLSAGHVQQMQRPVYSTTGKTEKPASHANAMGMLALIVGIVFIVLAGLIFATTTWRILPDFCKVLLIGFFALVLFGASLVAEKKLHIHKTGNGLYVLGSIFVFLTVLAACYFRFLGSAFVLEGINRYRVLWLGSLVTVGVWFLGLRRFHDRVFTHACLWGMTVSMMFLAVSFALDLPEFFDAMELYAFFLLLLEWMIGRVDTGNRKPEGAVAQESQGNGSAVEAGNFASRRPNQEAGWSEAGRMLLQEMARFVPVHFWVFAGLCACYGIVEVLQGTCRVFTLAALLAALTGTGILSAGKKSLLHRWIFALSFQYFIHYVFLGWLFTGNDHAVYGFLLAETVSVAGFLLGKRIRTDLPLAGGVRDIVCTAAGSVDGLAVILWMHLYDMTGYGTVQVYLAASGAVVLLAVLARVWSRRYPLLRNLSYIVCFDLTVTLYQLARSAVSPCPDYQVFALCYLCFLLLWNFWKQENCFLAVAVVSLLAGIDFPLSALPTLILAALMITGRKTGRQMPMQDLMLCFLYVLSGLGFYGGLRAEMWTLWVFLLLFLVVYVLLYHGCRQWLSCVPAVMILPVPLVLYTRYQMMADELYGCVAGALLVTGAAARCIAPIVWKENEGEDRWRIDFYHMLSVAAIAVMTFCADRYWRFAYLLLLGFYFAQYMTVKGFEGFEKVRKAFLTAAVFCLLSAFWLQPFVVWPSAAAVEINVLAAAVFRWSLAGIWGKTRTLQDVQTVGYTLCLVVLAVDAVFGGTAVDGLFLEGVCFAVFVWAVIAANVRWRYLSVIVMFGFAAGDFYTGSCLGLWGIGLFFLTFWLSYLVFYGGRYAGLCLHFFSSLLMIPVPFVLKGRYGVTGDWLYGLVAGCLLATGVAARCRIPVVAARREEEKPIQWRIDFYHILCAVPLLLMTVPADRYWRFAYVLLLGLYSIQYAAVKDFAGSEKLRRASYTAAIVSLLTAFWIQPFLVWPQVVELEISLLPVALFLWCMGLIWGKSETLWNIQTAGYVLLLVILGADGIRTGRVEDALLLGVVCLFVFVWAVLKSCVRWVRIAGLLIVAEALYMTKDFWFCLSWWVYLLAAGIGLLVFAAVSEKKKK